MDSNSNLTYYQSLLNTTISNSDYAIFGNVIVGSIKDTSLTAECPLFSDSNQFIISQGPMTDGEIIIGSTGSIPVIGILGVSSNLSKTIGAGTLSIDTIQNITTISSPTFFDMTLSSLTPSYPVQTDSLKKLISGLINVTSQITGTLPIGNGGTSLSTIPTNGQLLIGNGTNYTLAVLTQNSSSQVIITNGSGSITLSLPQNINTNSSVIFNDLTLSSLSASLPVQTDSLKKLVSALINLTTQITGILPIANGGTNLSTIPTNGKLLIGNGTNYTLANLTQSSANQVIISNGSGSITLSLPQDINTSANVQFNTTTVSNSYVTTLTLGQPVGYNTSGLYSFSLSPSMPVKTDSGSLLVSALISLTSDVTGILAVTKGGTGLSSTTANRILYSSSNNVIADLPFIANGVVQYNGSGMPIVSTILSTTVQSNITQLGTLVPALPINSGGTNLSTTPSNGQLLIGNGTNYTLATLTGTLNQISITNGSGSILLSLPQDINTTSSPTFNNLIVSTINKLTITQPATSAILTIANSKTLTCSNTLTFTGTDSSSVNFSTGGTVAYTSNNLSVFASTTSSQLAGVISDETGSGLLVFGTTPTFTTNITCPLIIGGTTTTSTLSMRTTSNSSSATGADFIWQTGNNGGTELMRLINGGILGIGVSNPDQYSSLNTDLVLYLKNKSSASTIQLIEANGANNDAVLLLFTNASAADVAIFLDDSDSQKLKIALGNVGTDANRNTNTKITITQTGATTHASTLNYVGFTDASNASAGVNGEVFRSQVSVGSAITLTTTVWNDITSLVSLTAGDWDVNAIGMLNGTLTGTNWSIGISSTSGNSMTGLTQGDNYVSSPALSTVGADMALTIPGFRVNISGTTTYYLKCMATFTIGTAKAYGRISARRMR